MRQIKQYQAGASGNEQCAEIVQVHDPCVLLYGGRAKDEEEEDEGMQPQSETEEETNRKLPGKTDEKEQI